MKSQTSVSRRSFFKRTTAIGGGMLLMGMTNELVADQVIKDTPLGWRNNWQPESPKRLSDLTHHLTKIAQSGEYGKSMVDADFLINGVSDKSVSQELVYAKACVKTAKNAPLRIIPGEKIVGSATYRDATFHSVPGTNKKMRSVSHITIGFDKALHLGYKAYRNMIKERLSRGDLDTEGKNLLNAMLTCLDAAQIWHQRNVSQLEFMLESVENEKNEELTKIISTLKHVPENPPRDFREAVQSLWSMYAFQRLMGNWCGIGRIDEMLGPYLKKDLKSGKLTLSEAREILAHFWIKGCEWIGCNDFRHAGSGDAQFYQNIILSGIDENGNDLTNEVTYLVLDIIEELHISDFPVAVRINSNTPDKLYERIAEVQRFGGSIVSIYNEDIVIDGLVKFGYPLKEARTFTNDGCWEVLIPGKTAFRYIPLDTLQMLHETLGLEDNNAPATHYETFNDLYQEYVKTMKNRFTGLHNFLDNTYNNDRAVCPLISIFVENCIERGRDYHNRGPKYSVVAPHAGGLPDVANSLLVIKKLVYEEKLLTITEFVEILRKNWEGNEALRRLITKRFNFYGNDIDEADIMLKCLFNDYTAIVGAVKDRNGIKRPAGISTFGREIAWLSKRKASPSGAKKDEVLATNLSPSPGTDRRGPTAAIKSHCKMDFTKVPNGATLELKILPNSVKGKNGVTSLAGLLKSFKQLGGFYLHLDVVDSATLLDAQRNPQKYHNLSVRVAGWSARFTTLGKDWQDMIINRTQQIV